MSDQPELDPQEDDVLAAHSHELAIQTLGDAVRAVRDELKRELRRLASEGWSLRAFRRLHAERVDRTVREQLGKFDKLSSLDDETQRRVRPVVAAAEESLASREWETTLSRLPNVLDPLAVLLTSFYFGGAFIFILVSALSFHLDGNSLFFAVAIAALVLGTRRLLRFILWWRLQRLVQLLTAAALVVGTLNLRSWWTPALSDLQNLYRSTRTPSTAEWLKHIDWPGALHAGIWLATAVAVIGLIPSTLHRVYRWITVASTYPKSSPVIQTARLINKFLEIAYFLETETRNKTRDSIAYLSGPDRIKLITELERTANAVAGSWAKSMKTSHRSADAWVVSQAAGIAAAVRSWQPRVAQGGAHLEDMREAFSIAVVNACDGDWQLLATQSERNTKQVTRRIREVIKRIAIIPVPFVISLLAATYVPLLPATYDTSIVVVGAMASFAYLLASLDSRFPEALSWASQFTQGFHK